MNPSINYLEKFFYLKASQSNLLISKLSNREQKVLNVLKFESKLAHSLFNLILVSQWEKFSFVFLLYLKHIEIIKWTLQQLYIFQFLILKEYYSEIVWDFASKGSFYSEGADAFVISSNRRTLLFSWAWNFEILRTQIMSHKGLKWLWRFK